MTTLRPNLYFGAGLIGFIANSGGLRHNGGRAPCPQDTIHVGAPWGAMSGDNDSAVSEQAFLRIAAANGLDTSDEDRMADLRGRVALMRQGLARLYEIDVAGAESPSVFIPERG